MPPHVSHMKHNRRASQMSRSSTSSVPETEVETINMKDIRNRLHNLRKYANCEIKKLPLDAKNDYQTLIQYTKIFYDTDNEIYNQYYNEVISVFSDLDKNTIKPRTIGSYFAGCMIPSNITNNITNNKRGCSLICAGQMPRPKNLAMGDDFCDKNVVLATQINGKYVFEKLHETDFESNYENHKNDYKNHNKNEYRDKNFSSQNNEQNGLKNEIMNDWNKEYKNDYSNDANTMILYVEESDNEKFTGFNQEEISELKNFGADMSIILCICNDGKPIVYDKISQMNNRKKLRYDELPIRADIINNNKKNSTNKTLLIILLIVLVLIVLYVIYKNSYKNTIE